MTRDVGEIELIGESLPEWAIAIAALLTQLGDQWFLLLVLCTAFLLTTKRADIVALFGISLGGIGLYRGLKYQFELARPAYSPLDSGSSTILLDPIAASITTGGYGFPSGHATMATIVYLGLASSLAIGTRRQRYGAALGVIGLIAFTRIALSVHYLVDVLAGIALGATMIGLLLVLPRLTVPQYRVTLALVAAIPFCGLYYLTSGGATDSLLLLGAVLVLLTAWQFTMLFAHSFWETEYRIGTDSVLRASTAVFGLLALGAVLWYRSMVPADPSSSWLLVVLAVLLVVSVPTVRVLAANR